MTMLGPPYDGELILGLARMVDARLNQQQKADLKVGEE
jgi:hypothetical protein